MQPAVLRIDSWTHGDDALLAETVLQYMRAGKTKQSAFEAVANQTISI